MSATAAPLDTLVLLSVNNVGRARVQAREQSQQERVPPCACKLGAGMTRRPPSHSRTQTPLFFFIFVSPRSPTPCPRTQYNFVGRILGPRGMTAKQLEHETGCKIMVRGKGSMRDRKKVRSVSKAGICAGAPSAGCMCVSGVVCRCVSGACVSEARMESCRHEFLFDDRS